CDPSAGDDITPCATDADCCIDPPCSTPVHCSQFSFPNGLGLVTAAASQHPTPAVDAGDATHPGRNVFAFNARTPAGANVALGVRGSQVPAVGNRWEHCGPDAPCDLAAVQASDLRLAAGASVVLGLPPDPHAGAPVLTSISPARPVRGDLVRVFGQD